MAEKIISAMDKYLYMIIDHSYRHLTFTCENNDVILNVAPGQHWALRGMKRHGIS